MEGIDLVYILNYLNFFVEIASLFFITYVFFDLKFMDRRMKLTQLSETFEKFKRYEIFKTSLLFLILNLYFNFLAKFSIHLGFGEITYSVFILIANLFLFAFASRMYRIIHDYIPQRGDNQAGIKPKSL